MPRAPDQRAPNYRLREAITEAGLGYDGVARAVVRVAAENGEALRTNKSAVAHWVAGVAPIERTALYLAEALSRRTGRPVTLKELGLAASNEPQLAGAQPIETATLLSRADVEHRGYLAAAVYTASAVAMPLNYDAEPVSRLLRARTGNARVGAEEITVIRHITGAFGAADEILGGGHGLSTVATYFADTATPLLTGRFASGALRREAYAAVAELAWLLGWKHHDLSEEGAAQRYYLLGFQLAVEADPNAHAAWMMRAIAHQPLSLHQHQHSRDLIQSRAQARSRPRRRRHRSASAHHPRPSPRRPRRQALRRAGASGR